MDFDAIRYFFNMVPSNLQGSWHIDKLTSISNIRLPDLVTGDQDSILRADIAILWTNWFLESLCDPEAFIDSYPGYAFVVQIVNKEVPTTFASIPKSKHEELTVILSRLIDSEILRRQTVKRTLIDDSTKERLFDIYGSEPRCWLCGYKFTNWAIDKFFKRQSPKPVLPSFVDYLMPRGLRLRDLQIEIDHMIPFSLTKNDDFDNLRLACGWCNARKGAKLSVYDVSAQPGTGVHPKLGRITLPHPFWVIRILCLRRHCEYEGGCSKSLKNSELTVAPKHSKGAMNPLNLRVTCLEHDSLGSNRLISRLAAEQIWKVPLIANI
jgi:HNH endonuclease